MLHVDEYWERKIARKLERMIKRSPPYIDLINSDQNNIDELSNIDDQLFTTQTNEYLKSILSL